MHFLPYLKSIDEFLNHFEKFEIKESKLINPIFNGKEVVTNGKASISVETAFDNELDIKNQYLCKQKKGLSPLAIINY